uniref:uncharacterized protein LOC120327225 n=1 Tax=Styela clava TaxID=7725 RepID=UPI0019396736|nr:uncharacterized protein LOC120327225 [Styela clava]
MRLLLVVLLFTLLVGAGSQDSNKFMVCKEMESVFSDEHIAASNRRGVPGPPGKKGPPGIKGQRGLPGVAGQSDEVDYDRIEQIVKVAINSELDSITERLRSMERRITNITSLPELQCVAIKGMMYDGKCYWVEISSSKDTNILKAKQICEISDSRLADVYSRTHYDDLMKYLRMKLPKGYSDMFVWTGIQRNSASQATLSTGQLASYIKARSDKTKWENAEAQRTHAYLRVLRDTTSTDQGFGSIWPSWEANGVLCQTL